ncbi:MAG: N-acetyl-gamma-glutamyl-phosphate reductase [Planctomycetota bacterium]
MIRACVIGAGGFGGANIIELLVGHPEVEIAALVDVDGVGAPISARHRHLAGFCDLPVRSPEALDWSGVDVAFSATPDGVGMQLARECRAAGVKLIDYSGDFRFGAPATYAEYARRIGRAPEHAAPELLDQTTYGLAELHRKALAASPIVGNPGCFAVSTILGFAPAVQAGLVDPASLIADAKTGVSGAGIKPNQTFHYPLRYENMNAYKIGAHQHCMEIEHELGLLASAPLCVTLTTQVVPLCRGIMTVCYGQLRDAGLSAEQALATYRDFYADDGFVTVEAAGVPVSNNDVRGSNRCVLGVNVDTRTGRLLVVSHIDNLMKGQAGSALQNMNLMFGLDEATGLRRPPFYP